MDTKHREVLRKNRRYIVENIINTLDVCDELYSFEPQILNDNMKEDITVAGSQANMNRKLLDTITYRGSKAYELFVEALRNTDNREVADKLATLGHIETLPASAEYSKSEKQPQEQSPYQIQQEKDVEKTPIEESSNQAQPQEQAQEQAQESYPENWPNPATMPVKKSEDCQLQKSLSSQKVYDTFNTKTLVITVGSSSQDVLDSYKSIFENENYIMNVLFSKAFISPITKAITNKSAEDIPKLIEKEITKDRDIAIGCFILLAHTAGRDPGQIYGRGGSQVDMKMLEDMCKQCDKLKDIPKVFIINSYPSKERSEEVGRLPLDATAESPLGKNDDDLFIITWKCMEGYDQFIPDVEDQSKLVGSWFFQALKYVIENFHWELSFFDLIDKANWLLAGAKVNGEGRRAKVAEIVFLQKCMKKELYL